MAEPVNKPGGRHQDLHAWNSPVQQLVPLPGRAVIGHLLGSPRAEAL